MRVWWLRLRTIQTFNALPGNGVRTSIAARLSLMLESMTTMTGQNLLQDVLPRWRTLAKAPGLPRRTLRLPDWQADWNAGMALLARHARNGGEPAQDPLQGHAALEHAYGWEAAAQTGSNLLLKGIDRGFAPTALQQMHADVADLWLEHARLLAIARDSLQQQGHDIMLTASLQPRTTQHYEYALQLLSLGVLLDAQERLPALVEQVLCFETDRVLDYLSAPALGLVEASDEVFHPRPFADLFAPLRDGEAFDPSLLASYLQVQYRDFFLLAPKAQKRTRRLIGPNAWGYWAFEVAAMVVLYGGDDAALRSCPHYPADLADFARR
jgi:hypothetical protein